MNDRKLDLKLQDLSFYRAMEANDRQALRAAIMQKEDRLVQMDIAEMSKELELGLKGFELSLGYDAQKFGVEFQGMMQNLQMMTQEYFKQSGQDFAMQSAMVDLVIGGLTENMEENDVDAIVGTIGELMPGFTVPAAMRPFFKSLARQKKAVWEAAKKVSESSWAGSFGDFGVPNSEIVRPFDPTPGLGPVMQLPASPDMRGEGGVPRYDPTATRSGGKKSPIEKEWNSYEAARTDYESLVSLKESSPGSWDQSDDKKLAEAKIKMEAKREELRRAAPRDPAWHQMRGMVQAGMVEGLKHAKEQGSSPERIKQLREMYKREWEGYYGGKWDEESDFYKQVADSNMFTKEELDLFGDYKKINYTQVIERIKAKGGMDAVKAHMDQWMKDTGGLGWLAGDEAGMQGKDSLWELWRQYVQGKGPAAKQPLGISPSPKQPKKNDGLGMSGYAPTVR